MTNTTRTATAAHTPGPWLIGRGADFLPIVHTAPDTFSPSGQGIAHVCKRAMASHDHEANARLIAAAPDLLDVVKRFRDACRAYLPPATEQAFCGLFASAEDAIARAEGRQP